MVKINKKELKRILKWYRIASDVEDLTNEADYTLLEKIEVALECSDTEEATNEEEDKIYPEEEIEKEDDDTGREEDAY